MRKTDDGGCAFPVSTNETLHAVAIAESFEIQDAAERERVYITERAKAARGMSLRDYFAARAMPVIYGRVETGGFNQVAKLSYELADAMIEASKS